MLYWNYTLQLSNPSPEDFKQTLPTLSWVLAHTPGLRWLHVNCVSRADFPPKTKTRREYDRASLELRRGRQARIQRELHWQWNFVDRCRSEGLCCCSIAMLRVVWTVGWKEGITGCEGGQQGSRPWTRRHHGGAMNIWPLRCWGLDSQTAGWVSFGCKPHVTSFTNVDWVVEGLQVLSRLVFIVYLDRERRAK